MTDIRAQLDAMQARCDAATEGPWVEEDHTTAIVVSGTEGYSSDGSARCVAEVVYAQPDRDFIAAARADLPRLITAVRAVLDRARMEQEDAEINDGLMLISQQARKQAWADAARALTAAMEAS